MRFVLLVLAACAGEAAERADDRETPEPLAAVGAEATLRSETGYVGVLTPRESAEITAPFTTNVIKFTANLGEHVEVGARLAVLDDKPLREQLAIARAELEGIQAQAAAVATTRNAAAASLRREREGQRAGIVSRADVANASYRRQEAASLVAKARASIAEQQARIRAIEVKLDDMTLTAPIAGRVSLRYVEAGARIEEGQPIVRVVSTDDLYVKFAIPADHAGRIAAGDSIAVTVQGLESRLTATVKSVAPELDPIVQMIVAEAELADGSTALQPGMVCRAHPR